jgi:hypothetical protein
MEHIIYRCKHCNKEYVYCTYGNGEEYGTEKGCSRDYCSECQKAIDNALKNIPKKYEPRLQKINDENEINIINKIFDEEKEKYFKEVKVCAAKVIGDWGYKNVECCYIDNIEFYRCFNDNNEIEIKVSMEYDLINDKFTEKRYKEYGHGTHYKNVMQFKLPDFSKTKPINLSEPLGNVFFNDIDYWTLEVK